ncbi:MAG: hypothetical protein CM1200mP5_4270 [Candidatus Pelagibacterales bacterium]|nr:MAG: hypothetical protein CM1200mP5_4270 [Pelagibacterales bacterium]
MICLIQLTEFILLTDITEWKLYQSYQKLESIKIQNHTGKEPYNYFMVAIFPQSQARLLDYNRLIKDLYGYTSKDFIKENKKKNFLWKNKVLHLNQKNPKHLVCI